MSRELRDKIVVVTGGAGGIGFAIADKFLESGAKLAILLDINEKQGAEAAKTLTSKHGDGKSIFVRCDVTSDLEEISKMIIDTYADVDVLVNSAGVVTGFQTWNETLNRRAMEVNATAPVLWTLKFWEHMRTDKEGQGGIIINLSSVHGEKANPFSPVYQASTFPVLGLTKSLGHKYNYDRSGVRVVTLCPGFTHTNFTANLLPYLEEVLWEDAKKAMKESEWQTAEVVGNAAVEVFEKADSGTSWTIQGNKPLFQV